MINDSSFVVVDLETTGLVPKLDHIIEIAAVKVVKGEIVEEWHSLVNPGIFIPDEVTQYTGITNDMIQDAPSFSDLTGDYLNFLADGIFVAHNVDFDRDFVNEHLMKLEMDIMPNPYLCTIQLAKYVHPHLPKYNLGMLAESFGVELPQAHRAIHDARATAQLMNKFMAVLQSGGLKAVRDIPKIQNLPKEAKEVSVGQISLF